MTNILHIAMDFDRSSGITTYLKMLFRQFAQSSEYRLHLITNGGDALESLDAMNVHPVILPMRKGLKNIFFLPHNILFLKQYCEKNDIDIIHTHHRYPEFAASLVSVGNGIHTVTTAHSLVQGYQWISFRSEKIIAVSNAVRNEIINRYHVDEKKVETMYNCVEEMPRSSADDIANLRKELSIPEQNKIILYVGRVEAQKGVHYIKNAFRQVVTRCTNVTLLMVGNSGQSSQSTELVGNGSQLIILPPRGNIHPYFHMSYIVVLPTEKDSFPYVMVEAGAASKPFIGSSVDGIAEFIDDGKNGLLFPAGDEEKLALLIEELLNDGEKAALLGENLHKKVSTLPDCEEYCERLAGVYQQLCSGNN